MSDSAVPVPPRLCDATLAGLPAHVARPAYDRARTRIGMVHFGPGAFHRAHQAVYLDAVLDADPAWAICAVSLHSPGVRDALRPQDGLYTLVLQGERPALRVVGSIRELLCAPQEPEAVLARLADRDVVIARDDVRTTNPRTGTFRTIVSFPFAGSVLPVARGWGSADVHVGKASFRFVNSHLEAFGIPGVDAEQVRVAQAGELLAAQAALSARVGELPMVYVGDYNSRAPDAPAYALLLAGVGSDAWRDHPRDSGATCCFDATLTDPTDPLTSRIDLVLHGNGVRAARARVVGDDPGDRTASGLWPSDHAGVVARLVFPAGP